MVGDSSAHALVDVRGHIRVPSVHLFEKLEFPVGLHLRHAPDRAINAGRLLDASESSILLVEFLRGPRADLGALHRLCLPPEPKRHLDGPEEVQAGRVRVLRNGTRTKNRTKGERRGQGWEFLYRVSPRARSDQID